MRRRFFAAIALVACLFLLFNTSFAQAQGIVPGNVINSGQVCQPPPTYTGPPMGLSERVAWCMRTVTHAALTALMVPLVSYIYWTLVAIAALAMGLFGARVATVEGGSRLKADGVIMIAKVCVLSFIGMKFYDWYPWILGVIDDLIGMVASYVWVSYSLSCPLSYNIWARLDCAMDRIVGGLLPTTAITSGIIGLIIGSIVSGPVGLSMFLLGMSFFMTIITALFRAIYIYLASYIGIALLSLIAPYMFAALLFRATRQYFEKWLKMLFGMMLQPMLLFAYLTLLLAAFDVVIFNGPRSLYYAIAGPYSLNPNFRIGQYLIDTNAYVEISKLDASVNLNARELAAAMGVAGIEDTGPATGMNERWSAKAEDVKKYAEKTNAYLSVNMKAVDYNKLAAWRGMTYTAYLVQLLFAIITAVVIAYVLNTLLKYIPYISSSISNDDSMSNVGRAFEKSLENMKGAFKSKPGAGK